MKLKIEYDFESNYYIVNYLDLKNDIIINYHSPYDNLYDLLAELLSEIDIKKGVNYNEVKR